MRILAVDIGGSAVKYGICDETGRLTQTGSFPLPASMADFLGQLQSLPSLKEADGIALSAPGAVDCRTGIVGGVSAVPWIHGPSVTAVLRETFSLPVQIENDASCAALAELWLGAASDLENCCFVIFGTGIGGAVIKDRKIHRGASERAGEFGLILADCDIDTGAFHVWSHYSTNHTVRNAARECGLDEAQLDGITVFEQAAENPVFAKHVDRFYNAAANGLLNLQQMYDPQAILLGGGISARSDLLTEIEARIAQRIQGYEQVFIRPQLRLCHFRNQANLIGAVRHFLMAEL